MACAYLSLIRFLKGRAEEREKCTKERRESEGGGVESMKNMETWMEKD